MTERRHTLPSCDTNGLSRRDFLRAGGAGAGLSLTTPFLPAAGTRRGPAARCIFLLLTGGPSQLETWDPKPAAPVEVRGPFRPMRTTVPGLCVGEHLPRLARLADHYSLIRSLHHSEAAVHETGLQMLQTGRLDRPNAEHPHFGAVLSYLRPDSAPARPPFVILPGPLGDTGLNIGRDQGPGFLGAAHAPVFVDPACPRLSHPGHALRRLADLTTEPARVRERYGRGDFGASCLVARRLVESGTGVVVVNMFDSLFGKVTWDCHGDAACLPATLADYATTLCPAFDAACSALLEDLRDRGLLETTLVVAAGEMGRTPTVNDRGGRDHWPGCWSVMLAGGGVRGGRVVGASGRGAAEPTDRPVTPAELVATVYHALGVDLRAKLPSPDGRLVPLTDARPVWELF